jgi:hypothetical protein
MKKVHPIILFLVVASWFIATSVYSAVMLQPDGITLPPQIIRLIIFHSVLPLLVGILIAGVFNLLRENMFAGSKHEADSLQNNVVYIVSIALAAAMFLPHSFHFERTLVSEYESCFKDSRGSSRSLEYLYVKKELQCPSFDYFRENRQGFYETLELP